MLRPGSVVYRLDNNGASTNLHVDQLTKPVVANITDKDDYLSLGNISGSAGYVADPNPITLTTTLRDYSNYRAAIPQSFSFFGNVSDDNTKKTLRFTSQSWVLQAVNVTLKFRPQPTLKHLDKLTSLTNMQSAIDSFPRQTEAGVDFGLAFGPKFNYNVFRKTAGFLGKQTLQISATPGVLVGGGAVSISSSNARELPGNYITRSAAYVSGGVFLMIGVNNFNFGIVRGVDHLTGDLGKNWVFQDKGWWGISLALDILK
ncbi:hypothetical protein GCM10028816_51850 [Spirosoma lituiforme]